MLHDSGPRDIPTVAVIANIQSLLRKLGASYREHRHPPVYTSDAAAEALGHSPEQGTKSLALEDKEGRIVVVTVSGVERVDFKNVAKVVGCKRLSFCSDDTVSEKLHVNRGALAPFGYAGEQPPVLVWSSRIFEQERVFINPGVNDLTYELNGDDFRRIASELEVRVAPSERASC